MTGINKIPSGQQPVNIEVIILRLRLNFFHPHLYLLPSRRKKTFVSHHERRIVLNQFPIKGEGIMTFIGVIGHALPFLIQNFRIAFIVAIIVVCLELIAVAFIRNKYMDTPVLTATFQIIVGGAIVVLEEVIIGNIH